MKDVPSRREFVAAATLTALTAGCTADRTADESDRTADGLGDRQVADADRYGCDNIYLPDPDEPDHEDAPEPLAYPEFEPGSSAVLSPAAKAFAVEFERAYRRNEFLERHGDRAREFNLSLANDRTRTTETGTTDDAAVVSLAYDLETKTVDTIGDGWNIRIVYYVDERLALRAEHDGETDASPFEPDPRDEGEGILVACFD